MRKFLDKISFGLLGIELAMIFAAFIYYTIIYIIHFDGNYSMASPIPVFLQVFQLYWVAIVGYLVFGSLIKFPFNLYKEEGSFTIGNIITAILLCGAVPVLIIQTGICIYMVFQQFSQFHSMTTFSILIIAVSSIKPILMYPVGNWLVKERSGIKL